MPYTIHFSNRDITVAPNTINRETNIGLIGRYVTNYGQEVGQDLANLLQSFAGAAPPDYGKSVPGQLWFDTNSDTLKIFNGSAYHAVGGSDPIARAIGEQVTDNLIPQHAHDILSFYIGRTRFAILSHDPRFTPNPALSGFSDIYPGLNLSSQNDMVFAGTALNTNKLDGLNSGQFMRSDVDTANNGNVTVATNLFVGPFKQSQVNYDGNDLNIINKTNGGSVKFTTYDTQVNRHDVLRLKDDGNAVFTANVAARNINVTSKVAAQDADLAGNLEVLGYAVLGSNAQVSISGGLYGQVLGTDGTGNLYWRDAMDAITPEQFPVGDYGPLIQDFSYMASTEYGTNIGWDMATNPKYGVKLVDLGGLA
jgi:hypothetical protein